MCVGVPPPQVRQQKREVELALKLAELCSSYIGALADGTLDAWTSKMRAEAKDLASVSFGDCLLFVVAELYTVTPPHPRGPPVPRPHTPALPADPLTAPPPQTPPLCNCMRRGCSASRGRSSSDDRTLTLT